MLADLYTLGLTYIFCPGLLWIGTELTGHSMSNQHAKRTPITDFSET
jgi:hypothetical protein